MFDGLVEILTPFYVSGWAAGDENGPTNLIAECNGRILGAARASIWRSDLGSQPSPCAGFHIDFTSDVAPWELPAIRVSRSSGADTLGLAVQAQFDDRAATQVFILGSPRSGTSELAETLAANLDLPWSGEGHAAPALAGAAAALLIDPEDNSSLVCALAEENLPATLRTTTRRVYFSAHGSVSFLDKTPGEAMIRAAPFLQTCFPDARFIFLRRNGIANVLSRRQKFGGDFADHCKDWAACMEAWEDVVPELTHSLEIEQERMLEEPYLVARIVCDFLVRQEASIAVSEALRLGRRERTGAGIGKTTLADTDWPDHEISQFRTYCGSVMEHWGYAMG